MELLVIRHAIAEDRERFATTGQDDGDRPLSPKGRKRMDAIARGLARCRVEIGSLATSPLRRAVETAEILASACGAPRPEANPMLLPDAAVDPVLAWLVEQQPQGAATVVGHEPQLGILVSWLLTGAHRSILELKKGAACLLAFEGRPAAGEAILRWALMPGQLRRLAR
jgi:phosphohistidine phosphatase